MAILADGEFRIAAYDYAGERSDIIYRKGSCPIDGNSTDIEEPGHICNVTGALTGENIV